MRLAPHKLSIPIHGPELSSLVQQCVQSRHALGPHELWSRPPANQQPGQVVGNATLRHSMIFWFMQKKFSICAVNSQRHPETLFSSK